MKSSISSSRVLRRVFFAVLLECLSFVSFCEGQQISITFDDLPAHNVLPPGETRLQVVTEIIQAVSAAHLPAPYGFINGIRTEEEPETKRVLDAWRDAGFPLGNHTWSHMNLNQHSLAEFETDTIKNEPLLQTEMGDADWHWFRFPYLAEGDTQAKRAGIRAFLGKHGYKIAGVTMSFSDYNWNAPYARCRSKGDEASIVLLEDSYISAAEQSIGYYRQMSKVLYGRDIPYVLLMHLGAFDARMLPQLLDVYRKRGFTFVSLSEAQKDKFYLRDNHPTRADGPQNLEAAMIAKHLPLPVRPPSAVRLDTICQ
jgi:peptidoglycan/xylan/chitin deacetylase (PgdA/CDA1 family)